MTSLYEHQVRALLKAIPVLRVSGGFYLAHDPGAGKTLTAIGIAKLLQVESILAITTPAGLGVWRNEVNRWWPSAHPINLYGELWPKKNETISPIDLRIDGNHLIGQPPDTIVWITTWGQLTEVPADKKRWTVNEARIKFLLDQQPELVIFDEAHKAKTPSAKRTNVMRRLAHAVQYRLYLSGTPIHSPLDYWAPYREIIQNDPTFQQTFTEFKSFVAVLHPEGWVKKWKPHAVEYVHRIIEPYTHYFDTSELNLPAPVETVVPVRLAKHERQVYDTMERDLVVEFGNDKVADATIVLTKALRLQQITSGFVKTTDGSTQSVGGSKLEVCMDLIEQRPNAKIVVACEFLEDLNRLSGELERAGRPWALINGATPAGDRTRAGTAFRERSAPIVMLIQNRAGGESLTLNAAHTLIFYSFNPSTIVFRQVQGRCYGRLNDVNPTGFWEFLYLAGERTHDETLLFGLQEKLDMNQLAKTVKQGVLRRSGGLRPAMASTTAIPARMS